MISLTDEMREHVNNSLANSYPCIIATATPDGEPSIGFRGSVMVFDDQRLAYWERSKRSELRHLEANPKIVVMYRNHALRVGWKFHGVATIHYEGPVREQVMSRVVERELTPDPERKGFAVVIQVNKVTAINGQVLQER